MSKTCSNKFDIFKERKELTPRCVGSSSKPRRLDHFNQVKRNEGIVSLSEGSRAGDICLHIHLFFLTRYLDVGPDDLVKKVIERLAFTGGNEGFFNF